MERFLTDRQSRQAPLQRTVRSVETFPCDSGTELSFSAWKSFKALYLGTCRGICVRKRPSLQSSRQYPRLRLSRSGNPRSTTGRNPRTDKSQPSRQRTRCIFRRQTPPTSHRFRYRRRSGRLGYIRRRPSRVLPRLLSLHGANHARLEAWSVDAADVDGDRISEYHR